jgi:hypothetical protein
MCLSDIMLAVRVFAGRFEQAVAASSGPGGRPEATSGSEQGRRREWAVEILGRGRAFA